jgi:hypothetical protein
MRKTVAKIVNLFRKKKIPGIAYGETIAYRIEALKFARNILESEGKKDQVRDINRELIMLNGMDKSARYIHGQTITKLR